MCLLRPYEFGQYNKKRRAEVARLNVPDKKVNVNGRVANLMMENKQTCLIFGFEGYTKKHKNMKIN